MMHALAYPYAWVGQPVRRFSLPNLRALFDHWFERWATLPEKNETLDAEACRRISAGIRELERMQPGAAQLISLRKLNIAYGETCMLGQIFGQFTRAPESLRNRASELGFLATETPHGMLTDGRLTWHWTKMILGRRH